MPKIFPEEQRIMVRDLSRQGKTNVEIAAIMLERFPADWNSKYANRTVARILNEAIIGVPSTGHGPKTLDEMTREERFKYIEGKLQATPRFLLAFSSFSPEEKNVFVDEFLSVIKSTDTLTEVEEQVLFAAVQELILSFKALNRKEKEEQWRDQSLEGIIKEDDIKYRRHVDDKYAKERDQHIKAYQKFMDQLKMSREQRLKEVRSQKQTLIDLAEELSNKNAQSEMADEIERLSKMKDDELKRLLDNGHLYGTFEEYQ